MRVHATMLVEKGECRKLLREADSGQTSQRIGFSVLEIFNAWLSHNVLNS